MEHSASIEPFVIEEEKEDTEVDYSLVFCNPKEPKNWLRRVLVAYFRAVRFPMDLEQAELHFFRIFRIKATESASLQPYEKALMEKFGVRLQDYQERKKLVEFQVFATLVLDCICLLLRDELGLEVKKPYISKLNHEAFFDIKASDDILKEEAIYKSYRLQFKQFQDNPKKYQDVPPYVAFQAGKDLEQHLKSYNKSLFNDIDRIRLIASIIDSKLDRGELYSLDILLSEICLSHKHNTEDNPRKNVDRGWFSCSTVSEEDEEMRMTCGERTAMFHSWYRFFYQWWSFPGLIGLGLFIIRFSLDLSENNNSIEWNSGMGKNASPMFLAFAVFLFIYSSVGIALWRRKESSLAWHWGTTETPVIEAQRLEFQGEWHYDDVTGLDRKERQPEGWSVFKRTLSFVVIILFILGDISIIALIFQYKTTLKSTSGHVWGSFLNAFQAKIMGFIYSFVVRWLNNWENIEFDREYYNALCVKQFLFQFVNAYASLFYIAFVKNSTEGCIGGNCLYELDIQFLAIFGVFWGFNLGKTLLSICYPKLIILWIQYKYNIRWKYFNKRPQTASLSESEKEYAVILSQESILLHDHIDFIILYGYILMFSACFPLASSLLALTAFLDWVRKRYRQEALVRRPFPQYANGVGIWNKVMLFMNFIAAFTNPAIVIFTAKTLNDASSNNIWIIFLATSFGLLLVKLLLNQVLPTVSRYVESGMAWGKRQVKEKLDGKVERLPSGRKLGASPGLTDSFWQEFSGELTPKPSTEDISINS